MSVLAVHPFRRMIVAWTLSNVGDSVLYLSLAIWAKDLTGRDSAAGLVFLFLGLPALLAPLTGQIADRMSRRRLVVAVNLLAAGGVSALWFVDSEADIWIIYVVTFGYGLLGYTTGAASSGLVRDALTDEQLADGNGLLQTIDQGARLLSPLIGAGVYAAFGGTAIAITTAVFLTLAALVMATVQLTETPPQEERTGFFDEARGGFRHIRQTPVLARVTVALAIAFAVTGISNTTTFAIIDQGLSRDATFYGIVASIQGAGSLLGGLASGRVTKRLGEVSTIAAGLSGVAVGFAVMLIPVTAAVLAASFIIGLAVPCFIVGFVTLRQRLTPDHLQGRTAAATLMALNGPQTIGTALGASLIALVDYRLLVAAMAAMILVCVQALRSGRAARAPSPSVPAPPPDRLDSNR